MVRPLNTKDLSVVIPTFRREREVVRAIESVLTLDGLQIEVFVEDDSPEGSAEPFVRAIIDPRVTYRRRHVATGGRPAIVRNDAAVRASGRYLYFLDDDDQANARALTAMVAALERTGNGVAIGVVRPFGPLGNKVVDHERLRYQLAERIMPRVRSRFELVRRLLFRDSIVVCSACMIRRSVFEEIGGFDPTVPLYEDVGMYIRAIRRAGFVFVPEVLLQRRTGEASLLQNETDGRRTSDSYRMIHHGYRNEFGRLEYLALRIWTALSRQEALG